MSFFGFGQSAEIDIQLDGMENRKMAEMKTEDGKKERYYLYYDGESVSGKVTVSLKKPGSRFEHQGVKIEFVGQIELYYDRGNHHEFTSLVKELARPGDLMNNTSFDFEFNQVEKPYESYSGTNVRLRYFLRVTVVRRLSDIVREMDLLVHTLSSYPDMNNSIKMEVGIEDCLHIEFEYNKSKYHLKDVIVGKIYFLLVRIKIKHMEIAIIKRETTGSGPNTFTENETIAKYEIMDGAPVRGESIPIRVFLAGYDLAPTMRDINKKFSVRYYLNLVLVDEEERRYFKQQEITLWRKGERVRRPIQQQLMAQQAAMNQLSINHHSEKKPNIVEAANSQVSTIPESSSEQSTIENHNNVDTSTTNSQTASHAPLLYQQPSVEQEGFPPIPPGAAQPPSPQQSQSPMQEEARSPAATQNHQATEAVLSEMNVNSSANAFRPNQLMADSPPPLPTDDEVNNCPQLPTPPDEAPNGIESPEDEFMEAKSTSEECPPKVAVAQ